MSTAPDDCWQVLLAASFQRERVAARRLARNDAMSSLEALRQVLQAAAGQMQLGDFISMRQQARAEAVQRQNLRRDASRVRHLARRAAHTADPAAWRAWFDGSAIPNPGRLALGVLLQAPDGRRFACSETAGNGDSNDAEYLALILALEQALARTPETLVVHGDSRIVIDDVLGKNAPVMALQAYRVRARALLAQFPLVRLAWIPRAKNVAADALARSAHERTGERHANTNADGATNLDSAPSV